MPEGGAHPSRFISYKVPDSGAQLGKKSGVTGEEETQRNPYYGLETASTSSHTPSPAPGTPAAPTDAPEASPTESGGLGPAGPPGE